MRVLFRFAVYLVVLLGLVTARADDKVDFFRAVGVDDVRTVKSLLAQGFDPNTLSEKGQTPLFVALREGAPRVASELLAHPALKVDAANAAGETALMMAALRGAVDVLPRLMERGAALERPGWTPLHYAASGPETRAVAWLLDRGARIDAPSPNRSTALMMAARYGPESSVDLLLARGADVRLRNDLGLGPADFARLGGREALAERLQRLER